MTSRVLPPDEWHRLSGCHFGEVWRGLRPADTTMLVVEHGGEIIAHWALLRIYHVEGLWIRPDHQKRAGVARRLLAAMRRMAIEAGARAVMTGAETPDVGLLLDKLGATKLAFDSYVIPLEERPCH